MVEVSETLSRGLAGGVRWQALRDQIARVHLEMKRELLVDFLLDGR